jgi:hypothetical protein
MENARQVVYSQDDLHSWLYAHYLQACSSLVERARDGRSVLSLDAKTIAELEASLPPSSCDLKLLASVSGNQVEHRKARKAER